MACSQDKRGSWAVMTDKGIKAVIKATPDHVNSVRNRLIDHLTVKDQEDISKIFDRITTKLRSQFRAEDN
jgi:DNA-binding MarR family transcriptional regulator